MSSNEGPNTASTGSMTMLPLLALPAGQTPEMLGSTREYPQYRTPKMPESGSNRSTEPRNTANTRKLTLRVHQLAAVRVFSRK